MKTNFRLTLPLLALAATAITACSDDENMDNTNRPDPNKDLIDFTGTDGGITRAGLQTRADGQGEMKSFGGETKVAMYIKSDGATTSDVRHTITEMNATTASDCSVAMHLTAASKNGDVQAPHDHLQYIDAASYRYWDDAFGRKAKLSVYAIAVPGKTASLSNKLTGKTGENGDRPYVSSTNQNWFTGLTEESFVWGVMHDNFQNANTITDQDICYSNNINEDSTEKGVYRYYNSGSNTMTFYRMEGDRMKWYGLDNKSGDESTSTAGKFDQGHLIFKHALSKITVNLFEADNSSENKGFDNSNPNDFKFPTDASGNVTSNVWLIDFPYENKFDLNAGDWKEYTSSNSALKIGEFKGLYYDPALNTSTNKQKLTVSGLVLPGKNLNDDTKNSLRFIIDGNEYFVTSKQIATAIQTYYAAKLPDGTDNPNANATLAGFTTMKQGEHYEINITVSKSKIDAITAQLVDWEKVSANITDPSNAYVKIQVEERSNTSQYKEYVSNGYSFDLYRAAETEALNTTVSGENNYYNGITKYNWKTGYVAGSESASTDKAKKTFANSTWSTEWFWPNNTTFYHFRMVGNSEGTESTPSNVIIKKDTSKGDYYEITSGNITGSSYKDYTWAAPFLKNDGAKWDYDLTDGFDGKEANSTTPKHQIYKAIGATNDKINLMMFHMTSQIFFNVKTTTENDKVELRNSSNKDTEVELLYFYNNGIVRVGNGLVEEKTDSFTPNAKIQFVNYTAEVAASASEPAVSAFSRFQYGVVPQALSGTHGSENTPYTVGIRITTPNGNQYVVKDISQVLAATADISSVNLNNPYTESTEESGKYTINRWYPGYKYTYTVTLKKTGIINITAQLVDWETVKGDLGEITLEN